MRKADLVCRVTKAKSWKFSNFALFSGLFNRMIQIRLFIKQCINFHSVKLYSVSKKNYSNFYLLWKRTEWQKNLENDNNVTKAPPKDQKNDSKNLFLMLVKLSGNISLFFIQCFDDLQNLMYDSLIWQCLK